MPLAIKGGRRVADHPTPQGNEETVEARARAVLPEDIWRSIPVYMHKSIEQRLAAALAPPIREHGEGVRELAAEIVDEAARCWTWEAGDEAGHAYRLKACAERREEWEDDDCPHDGSCVECVSDMHEHFETSASKERRRELRNLAAKIRGLPAHVIVRQSLGEYLPCEHSSEIVNELGNTIKFRIFAQAGQTRDGDDGGLPKVVVHAFGPTSKAIHTWTVNEARELHRLLSLAFPALSAQPVKDAVREDVTQSDLQRRGRNGYCTGYSAMPHASALKNGTISALRLRTVQAATVPLPKISRLSRARP
jgi:hypothetical protein